MAWLEYAASVVLGDHHTEACVAAGGGTLEADGTPELRWPGYLGERFARGGLLLVGNVHRNFASDGVPESGSMTATPVHGTSLARSTTSCGNSSWNGMTSPTRTRRSRS